MQNEQTAVAPQVGPELDGDGAGVPPRRRTVRWWVWAGVGIVVAGLAVWLVTRSSGDGSSSAAAKPATTLASVTKRDLVETDTESGTLGYTDSRSVVFVQPGNAAAGSGGSRTASTGNGSSTSNAVARPLGSGDAALIDYQTTASEGAGTTVTGTGSPPPAAVTVTVSPRGTGSGTIAGKDASGTLLITCTWNGTARGGTCSADVPAGEAATLTLHAAAAPGSALTSWTTCPGVISPDGQACTLALDGASLAIEIDPVFTRSSQGSGGSGGTGGTGSTGQAGPGGTSSSGSPTGGFSTGNTSSGSYSRGTSGTSFTAASSSSLAGSRTSSGPPNIVTWLPSEGQVLHRGEILFRVNGKASWLMYGDLPAWRTLAKGVSDGADVRQLERNLVALGFDTNHQITVDGHFGPATEAAVKRWQKKIGAPQTGRVRLGTVIFLPGPRIVSSLSAQVGSQLQTGDSVMTTSSTKQDVTVALSTTNQTLASVGEPVTITLPNNATVPGTISSVGTVAQSSSSSASGASGQGGAGDQSNSSSSNSTINVTIALDRPTGTKLDQAPVDVDFVQETRQNVLAVPVTALLSLLGGGYAVEVSDGAGHTHLVAVTPGLYAGGYVEVTGSGLDEGAKVVVPA